MNVGKCWKGFSLIELLVTIAVAAILITIALPGFQGLLTRNELSAEYNKVLSSLKYARSEAVKRREDVTVSVSSTADGGWRLVVSDVDRDLLVREGRAAAVSVDEGSVSFNSLGRRDGDCVSWEACILTVSNSERSLELQVSLTGRVGKPISSS